MSSFIQISSIYLAKSEQISICWFFDVLLFVSLYLLYRCVWVGVKLGWLNKQCGVSYKFPWFFFLVKEKISICWYSWTVCCVLSLLYWQVCGFGNVWEVYWCIVWLSVFWCGFSFCVQRCVVALVGCEWIWLLGCVAVV